MSPKTKKKLDHIAKLKRLKHSTTRDEIRNDRWNKTTVLNCKNLDELEGVTFYK